MKKQNKNISFFLPLVVFVVLCISSCDDTWTNHYGENKKVATKETLWDIIKNDTSLSQFAQALTITGYDKQLQQPLMLTVWAPVNSDENAKLFQRYLNSAATGFDTLKLAQQYVLNHISQYSYISSGVFNYRILLLNKKITRFSGDVNKSTFANFNVIHSNLLARNGILHKIERPYAFFANIWEYFANDPDLDSIQNYLYSFNRITFDPSKSVPGDVNEDGEIVYLDSVTYNSNKMFRILGSLASEDSSYLALLPTNRAWNAAYANIKEYYKFYSSATNGPLPITADTLSRKYTTLSIVKDLVFSKTWQKSEKDWKPDADSLWSTTNTKFLNPFYLFEGLTLLPASNGKIYKTDTLKHHHYESWNPKIVVEAERTTGRKSTTSTNVFERYYGANLFDVSSKRYIDATPTGAPPANVEFEIPNTLSGALNPDKTIKYGAAYNIYCVFMPSIVKSTTAKPAKVRFEFNYRRGDGSLPANGVAYDKDQNGNEFLIDSHLMTKVLVASNFVFPFSEFGFVNPNVNVKLKVISTIVKANSVEFSRDLLIDCIILEPVH